MDSNDEIRSEDALFTGPEPWEPWETALVLWCLGLGIAGLLALGWLINAFILS